LTDSRHQQEIELYASAMDAADIPYERFGGDELMRRYPQFRVEETVDALFQVDSGIASPQKGNAAHIATARKYGATILDHSTVKSIRPFDGGVDIETDQGHFSCGRLIMTAGAWTDKLLAELGYNLDLTVSQEQVSYFATPYLREFSVGHFPIFIFHGDQVVYGFPVYGEVATKAAIDSIYRPVTVDTRTFEGDPEVDRQLEAWLARYIPGFLGPKLYTKTCLYTMPRDRNFVVDALPEYPQILVCVGAGHAYKFASLLGKILSELAIKGESAYPIEAFSLRRPAITDPNYQASFHI
jgi:sarcosine oxidase